MSVCRTPIWPWRFANRDCMSVSKFCCRRLHWLRRRQQTVNVLILSSDSLNEIMQNSFRLESEKRMNCSIIGYRWTIHRLLNEHKIGPHCLVWKFDAFVWISIEPFLGENQNQIINRNGGFSRQLDVRLEWYMIRWHSKAVIRAVIIGLAIVGDIVCNWNLCGWISSSQGNHLDISNQTQTQQVPSTERPLFLCSNFDPKFGFSHTHTYTQTDRHSYTQPLEAARQFIDFARKTSSSGVRFVFLNFRVRRTIGMRAISTTESPSWTRFRSHFQSQTVWKWAGVRLKRSACVCVCVSVRVRCHVKYDMSRRTKDSKYIFHFGLDE